MKLVQSQKGFNITDSNPRSLQAAEKIEGRQNQLRVKVSGYFENGVLARKCPKKGRYQKVWKLRIGSKRRVKKKEGFQFKSMQKQEGKVSQERQIKRDRRDPATMISQRRDEMVKIVGANQKEIMVENGVTIFSLFRV